MTELPTTTNTESGHDISLVSWFAGLSPEQRLAELESRVAFFHSLRVDATRMHQIVRERRRITPENAERPARYRSFG